MADVYRFACPDGQEFAWHGTLAGLRKEHPDARITSRLVTDELGQGSWEPYSERQAMSAERKAAEPAAEVEIVAAGEAPAKKAKA